MKTVILLDALRAQNPDWGKEQLVKYLEECQRFGIQVCIELPPATHEEIVEAFGLCTEES